MLLPIGGLLVGAAVWHCQGFTDATSDAGAPDAPALPPPDSALTDASAPPDAASRDASAADAASRDAGSADAAPADSGSADAGSSDASSADAGACSPACGLGRLCCGGVCVNPDNDPGNCGACGRTCGGATPFCDGTCRATPCSLTEGCAATGGSCCGSSCCAAGSICCKTEGPVATPPVCFIPTDTQKTCPQGCAPMCVSDRNLKRDVSPADERAVLEAVGRMPVSTWSYTTDGARVRHIGPMAQDFHSAFGVGVTNQAYDPIDAHGVELASIKALYTLVQEQSARIDRLERENRALRERLAPGPKRPGRP